MIKVFAFLDQWQTLIGSIIGGLFALWVALLVAGRTRRQDDLVAAMMLYGNLNTVVSAKNALIELAGQQSIEPENLPYWAAEKLVRVPISLSGQFEASRIRMMPIDVYLAVNLEMFQKLYAQVERKLDAHSEDYRSLDSIGKPIRKPEIMKADAIIIWSTFQEAVAFASCAMHIVDLRVIKKRRFWNKIRMRFLPTPEERRCRDRLSGLPQEASGSPARSAK